MKDTLTLAQAKELTGVRDECIAIADRIDGLLLADTEGIELDTEGNLVAPT